MVEYPGREANRGIRNPVQRLRTVAHLLRVAEAVLVEKRDLIVRLPLFGREARTAGDAPAKAALINFSRNRAAMFVWMPAIPEAPARPSGRRQRAPIAALRHEFRVSEAFHQHGPSARDTIRIPAGRAGFPEKP